MFSCNIGGRAVSCLSHRIVWPDIQPWRHPQAADEAGGQGFVLQAIQQIEDGSFLIAAIQLVAGLHHHEIVADPAVVLVDGAGQAQRPAGGFGVLGGGFFRLIPYSLSLWLLNKVRHQLDCPAIFYFHPWELDPDQPRRALVVPTDVMVTTDLEHLGRSLGIHGRDVAAIAAQVTKSRP